MSEEKYLIRYRNKYLMSFTISRYNFRADFLWVTSKDDAMRFHPSTADAFIGFLNSCPYWLFVKVSELEVVPL